MRLATLASVTLRGCKKTGLYRVMMLRDRLPQDVKANDGCCEAGPGVD